jgi:hypothetical protein
MNAQAFAPSQPGSFRIPDMPKDWFSYPLRFQAVAELAVPSQNIQIDAGSDFYLTALTYFATVDGGTSVIDVSTVPVPVVTALITDSGSNRQLMNAPVPISLIFGDGNHPHRLIHPRLFYRNSTITVALQSIDTDADTTWSNIWLNFEGFRIYG